MTTSGAGRALLAVATRFRVTAWLLWGLPWFVLGYRRSSAQGGGDWVNFFEFGARAMIGYTDQHGHTYKGGLHLYVDNPFLQIGPPPLLLLGGFQGLPISAVTLGFCLAMLAIGPLALWLAETCLPAQPAKALLCGLVLMPFWGFWLAGGYRHLDDVLALLGIAAAMWAIARDRPWLMALVLGTAIAAKPWAIVAAPLVLGLPRPQRALATLALLAVAGIWWAPFVLAAPDTGSALGAYAMNVDPGSVLHLFGIQGQMPHALRPLQLILGIALATVVALGRDWRLVPLAGVVGRIALDPYVWEYYGVTVMLLAIVADLRASARVPAWTLSVTVAFFALPEVLGKSTGLAGTAKAAWLLGAVVALARSGTKRGLELEQAA